MYGIGIIILPPDFNAMITVAIGLLCFYEGRIQYKTVVSAWF